MSFKRVMKSCLCWALSVMMLGSALPLSADAASAETLPGLGTVKFSWSREIYGGIEMAHVMSENELGLQRTYTATYQPKQAQITPVLHYGDFVMGGDIMSDMVHQEESTGKKVIFAVNGDAYDMSNGVSNGLMIQNGLLISTAGSGAPTAVGFLKDGSAVYGSSAITVTAQPENGSPISVYAVNKERKLDTENVYLMTEQFSKTTQSTQPGVEVVLKVTDPSYKGLKIGAQTQVTVESVNEVSAAPEKNNTGIEKGKLVISANSGSSNFAALKALTPKQTMTIDVKSGTQEVDWSQVQQAIGVFHELMRSGTVNETWYNTQEGLNPRTTMGIKGDGSLVFFQCDGRQAGFAVGEYFKNVVDYLKNEGCTTILNFDGGGSSTFTATLPGNETADILNRPSDGSERANCNALLFVADRASDPVAAEQLHMYPAIPEGYANQVMLLENGKISFQVKATDSQYHYAALSGQNISYSTEGGIGTISEEGVLTAASGAHEGKVIAQTDGGVKGEIKVQVVDKLTKLTADQSILSVAPGGKATLTFQGESDGAPVVLTSEALTFSLSDNSLGSMAADGTFTAADTQGTGELTISYKDYAVTMPVEIGKLPVPLSDFETSLEEQGWKWQYTNPGNGGDGTVSINRDERYIKTGDGSLRIDYDFATKPLNGTIAIEVGPGPNSPMPLEGQPKAIGCWIYGDGNGGWFRIQLEGQNVFAGQEYITWKGWKYIETPIPATAPFPYKLRWGVRLIGTASIANNKKGTIYVDGLRAVYDFKNDDNTAPAIKEGTEVTPADGAVNVSNEPDISLTAYDPQVGGESYTGIDTSRTKLWVNGVVEEPKAIAQEKQQDGSVKITFHPGAKTMLRPGVNKIKYRVEDNAGNKFFKEWSFTVAGYAVNLTENAPAQEKAFAGQTFHYVIDATGYRNFEELELELAFAPGAVTLDSVTPDSRVTVETKEQDDTSGLLKLKLSGMKSLEQDGEKPLVDCRFTLQQTAGGQTGIQVKKASVRQTGESTGTNLSPSLSGYDKEIAYRYTLSWQGSTVGHTTRLSLMGEDGAPVSGASFQVKKDNAPVAFSESTDENGVCETKFFGASPVDSKFLIWTQDEEGALSNEATITVLPSLGSETPEKLAVTAGEDPSTSVGIGWETSLDVTENTLILGKAADLSDGTPFTPETREITTTLNTNYRLYRAWSVDITGLEPDTVYYYKVGKESGWSSVNSFTTTPAGGDFTVAFYGDIQGSYNNFPNTVNALKGLYPEVDMNLLAGDVSDQGQSYSDWTALDSGLGSVLANSINVATIGNHDAYFDAQTFTALFNGPKNGTYETPRNYWFTLGDMVVYNLDTQANINSDGDTGAYDEGFKSQISNMKKVFDSSDKKYKVVLMHRSAYPMNYDEADVRELHAVFDRLNVSLVLSGHDHIYSRTQMYNGSKATDGNAAMYVCGGSSSGSKYYDADQNGRPWQEIVYDENNPVFTVLKMREGVLTMEAYAVEGGTPREIDSFDVPTPHHSSYVPDPGPDSEAPEDGISAVVKKEETETETIIHATSALGEKLAEVVIPKEIPAGKKFEDVQEDSWYKEYVDYVSGLGLVGGKSETRFAPEDKISRGELTAMLYRLSGEMDYGTNQNPFEDIADGSFYQNAAAWANAIGVVKGTDAGFSGEKNILRQDIAVVIYRYAKMMTPDAASAGTLDGFEDADTVSGYAEAGIKWAVANGILQGSGKNLNPKAPATRAQVAAMFRRFIEML